MSDSISYAKSAFGMESYESGCVLWNKWALYLICEDEKKSKLFQHRTLRHHLEIRYTAQGCDGAPKQQWGVHDRSANLTLRSMTTPDPESLRTTNCETGAPIRGSYGRDKQVGPDQIG
jgi:hypothetical protein